MAAIGWTCSSNVDCIQNFVDDTSCKRKFGRLRRWNGGLKVRGCRLNCFKMASSWRDFVLVVLDIRILLLYG
jgi:hypothetical protein